MPNDPIPTEHSAGAIKDQPAHSQFDPAAALVYASFIDRAYDMLADVKRTKNRPPQPANFPAGFRMTAWITMADFAIFGETYRTFYGYVATEIDDPFSHVIVIRGTGPHIELWDNLVLRPVTFKPVPSAGRVHAGFYRIYRTMEVTPVTRPAAVPPRKGAPRVAPATFAEQIERLAPTLAHEHAAAPNGHDGKHHFIVTGHSLGAALCTLYVMEHAVRKQQDRHRRVTIERLCTFASPRVGMQEFAEQFDPLEIDAWRIQNTWDLVPRVPPEWMSFQHVRDHNLFRLPGAANFNPVHSHSMGTYERWLQGMLARGAPPE